jgi:hypothetical protein
LIAKNEVNSNKYSGAFTFFGPGDYSDMYTALSRPAADNKLHFAGEALIVVRKFYFNLLR